MTYLIADSGSSKVDWVICDSNKILYRFMTKGVNPYVQNDSEICEIVDVEFKSIKNNNIKIDEIYFYGAGCRDLMIERLANILQQYFPCAKITVGSDLLAAAYSLFQASNGIISILGTGANTGVYIHQKILQNVSPLGYILGDEASGASLGKQIVSDVLKKQMPEKLLCRFNEEYNIFVNDVLYEVYKGKVPNKYLASYAPFVVKNKEEEYCKNLIYTQLRSFFCRNINLYDHHELPLGFCGSIAFCLQDEIKDVAKSFGYLVKGFTKSPIDGLVKFIQSSDK